MSTDKEKKDPIFKSFTNFVINEGNKIHTKVSIHI